MSATTARPKDACSPRASFQTDRSPSIVDGGGGSFASGVEGADAISVTRESKQKRGAIAQIL